MPSTTNLTRLSGAKRPTPLLLITLTGLSMSKDHTPDFTQLHQAHLLNKHGLNLNQFSQKLFHTIIQMMLGVESNSTTPMKMNGELILLQ
jgi:predicted amino acid-binding ACT domain protein